MKTSCKIIEDLLPLYVDEVCSEESRALVDEHLAECHECSEKLSLMRTGNEIKGDILPLKIAGKFMDKLHHKNLIKGVIAGILLTAAVIAGYVVLTQQIIMKVPSDKVTVSNISMLDDGNIAFHMYIDDEYDLNHVSAETDADGNMYITPLRAVIENKRDNESNLGLFNCYYGIAIQEEFTESHYSMFDFGDTEPNAVYLRLRDEDILIWEKGMELPPTSEEAEEFFSRPMFEGNG